VNTFTQPLILSAFKSTDNCPPNADDVLDNFRTPAPPTPTRPPEQREPPPASGGSNWLKSNTLLQDVVKDNRTPDARALEQRFHQLHFDLELLKCELQGANNVITGSKSKKKKKKKKKKTTLPLYKHTVERQGGTA
jgi:hypothetical protein